MWWSMCRRQRHSLLASICGTLAAVTGAPGTAQADVIIQNGYHFQQTPFYSGPGSMEMMLDSPVVTSTNATVANGLATAAAANAGGLTPVVENGTPVNVLPGDLALQNQLYSGVWGASFNAAFAAAAGSPPANVTAVMNTLDGPGSGSGRAYANYNFAPNLPAGDLASRTVAATLQNFMVPAAVLVDNGAHWITVNGVSANGTIARNGTYTINGFFVSDPWTGLALTNPLLASSGGLGLGIQTYLRYGADDLGGGNLRLAPWFQYFNPTGAGGAPPHSYSIVVDPLAPELPDTIDPFATLSDPSGIPIESIQGTNLALSTAMAVAALYLANNIDGLDNLPGFSTGTLDTSSVDALFFTLPGDIGGSGDWLFSVDGTGGGGCNVIGGMAIDAQTGLVDEATSFNSPVCLSTLDTWALDQQNGLLPRESTGAAIGAVPEPSSALLLLSALLSLAMFRRRHA
jgi:hypothetical protein